MRLPFVKVYRAFPELDPIPDEDCERMVFNIRLNHTGWLVIFPRVVAALACIGFVIAAIIYAPTLVSKGLLPGFATGSWWPIVLGVSTVLVTAAAYFSARDLTLWWGIRGAVLEAACPKCKSSLLGLRVQDSGVDPGVPGKSHVRCPECGTRHNLLEIGLTPRDLVPWEMRGVSGDIGRIRTDYSGRRIG